MVTVELVKVTEEKLVVVCVTIVISRASIVKAELVRNDRVSVDVVTSVDVLVTVAKLLAVIVSD